MSTCSGNYSINLVPKQRISRLLRKQAGPGEVPSGLFPKRLKYYRNQFIPHRKDVGSEEMMREAEENIYNLTEATDMQNRGIDVMKDGKYVPDYKIRDFRFNPVLEQDIAPPKNQPRRPTAALYSRNAKNMHGTDEYAKPEHQKRTLIKNMIPARAQNNVAFDMGFVDFHDEDCKKRMKDHVYSEYDPIRAATYYENIKVDPVYLDRISLDVNYTPGRCAPFNTGITIENPVLPENELPVSYQVEKAYPIKCDNVREIRELDRRVLPYQIEANAYETNPHNRDVDFEMKHRLNEGARAGHIETQRALDYNARVDGDFLGQYKEKNNPRVSHKPQLKPDIVVHDRNGQKGIIQPTMKKSMTNALNMKYEDPTVHNIRLHQKVRPDGCIRQQYEPRIQKNLTPRIRDNANIGR